MRNVPYKILFLCIFLPPVCYILTIQSLERYFQKAETAKLEDILIQHPAALYEGRYSVEEEISRNLGRYLKNSIGGKLGVTTTILVKTKDGQILYPPVFGSRQGGANENVPDPMNYVETAANNYKILTGRPMVDVGVKIRYTSWFSNSILVFYVLLAAFVLRLVVRRGLAETERREEEQQERIEGLMSQLDRTKEEIAGATAREKNYVEKIGELKKEKQDLSKDVDGLLEEMEGLETGLHRQRESRADLEHQVEELKREIELLREKGAKRGKKTKTLDNVARRFRLLYKNVEFSDRALHGFAGLAPALQLKGEEIIHQLNENDELITVRRKVFGKGGKMNVLELDFAYSGRLYFQKGAEGRLRVLAIGTKNSQNQDLAYIGKHCE